MMRDMIELLITFKIYDNSGYMACSTHPNLYGLLIQVKRYTPSPLKTGG